MSLDIYKPEKKSKIFFYVFFFATVLLGWGIYIYTRPLVVESACSEVALKTTGLSGSFKYDPLSDYDQTKAKCMQDVLSSKK
jgi:hypothetical protein